ncbi:transmembrane protein 70 homolog, mitochondrial [Drosophila pseudoobscura]|uniref:Transmembrane protein 70 homolog, mitochondrial n=1 Tax=Drosophila pseudoobscura pseudoobscura TaxID=46245 RepID=A0A6I8UCE6_DROPS|nr:transmembrane protein 70 homolog, mitochondrial [Drosophila pseudoobscura]
MFSLRAALPRGKNFAVAFGNAARHIPLAPSCRFGGSAWTSVPLQQEKQYKQQNLQCRRLADQAAGKGAETELQRVYYGTLAPRMKLVKFFSLSTSLAGIAAQPILLEQGMKIGGTGMAVFLCTIGGFFTFVTPLLLHFITKKYVTELHYNPATEEYTATTISLLLQKIKTKFRPGDVTVPEVPGMFTSFLVNKRPLFIDPALFEDPEHYVRIMGYDKPIDFKLDQSPGSEKQTKSQKQ